MGSNWSSKVDVSSRSSNLSRNFSKPIIQKSPKGNISFLSQQSVPPDYPEFSPTLFFVDLTNKNLNVSNKLELQEPGIGKSHVYLISQNGDKFIMTFGVNDPEFHFIKCREGPAIEYENNKFTQSCVKECFKQARVNGLITPLYVKHYEANKCKTSTNYSKSMRRPKKKKKKDFTGKIYVSKDDMSFLLPIEEELSIFYKRRDNNVLVKERLSDSFENQASIIFRIGKDICRVEFYMTDIIFTSVQLKVSRACQAEDPVAYFKAISPLNTRMYVPIPVSTYTYEDPMIKLMRKNRQRRFAGLKPPWLEETRKERKLLEGYSDDEKKEKEAKPSYFLLEKNGFVLKLKAGIVRAYLLAGEHLYDEFVRANVPDFLADNEDIDIQY